MWRAACALLLDVSPFVYECGVVIGTISMGELAN